jgi:hypothetical protein
MSGFEWADPRPRAEAEVSHDEIMLFEPEAAGAWIAASSGLSLEDCR